MIAGVREMSARVWVEILGWTALALAAGCSCKNKVRVMAHSPDARLQAFAYARECDGGATVGEHVHVSVLPRGQVPGDEDPNVLSADAGHDPSVPLDVRLTWETPTRLTIEIDPRVRFFRRHQWVRDVEIVYQPPRGPPHR